LQNKLNWQEYLLLGDIPATGDKESENFILRKKKVDSSLLIYHSYCRFIYHFQDLPCILQLCLKFYEMEYI